MNRHQKISPRQVALLLTDMKGSSSFYRSYGNLAGRVLIQKHNALLFPIIQNSAGLIVNTLGDSIIAVFDDPCSALSAAIAIQKRLSIYNEESAESERLSVRTVLHYGECIVEDDNIFGYAVTTASALIECCDAREILVTGAMFDTVKSSLADMSCLQKTIHSPPEALASQTIYSICWNSLKTSQAEGMLSPPPSAAHDDTAAVLSLPIAFLPYESTLDTGIICFYCGMSAHDAAHCPSKLIQNMTSSLERLAYVPFDEIQKLYHDYFADYVRPIQPSDDNRYTLLFEENNNSRFALGFFSLYEISSLFQLRFLYNLCAAEIPDQESPHNADGALLIGRDCLRVSRIADADDWFSHAVRQNPKDYRPYVDMAMVSIERMDPSQAISCLNKAIAAADTDMLRRHMILLRARTYEIAGALSRSCDDMNKILDPAHPWNDGLYYYASLLAKLGKTADAIRHFQMLFDLSHLYLMKVLLDPALYEVRDSLTPLIRSSYEHVYTSAMQSIRNIEVAIPEMTRYFSEQDSEYQTAQKLFHTAQTYKQRQSLGGLLDLSGIEFELNRLSMHAIEQRRRNAEENAAHYKKVFLTFASYFDNFPYARAVLLHDRQILAHFNTLIDRAEKEADSISLEQLDKTRVLFDELAIIVERLKSIRQRLEIQKNIYFIAEFSYKLAVAFFGTGILSGLFLVIVLSAYDAFSHSGPRLNFATMYHYCRYGLIVGFFSGITGAAVWFKRSFRRMFTKLGE